MFLILILLLFMISVGKCLIPNAVKSLATVVWIWMKYYSEGNDFLGWFTYRVYISKFIRYSRACGSYQDFLDRGLLLTRNLLNQGFLLVNLIITSKVLRSPPWLGLPLRNMFHKWLRIHSTCRKHFPVLSSCMTYYRVCYWSNMTCSTGGTGAVHSSGEPEFTTGF